ncbi:MAG: AraC family transcriptional regulator [Hyphomicrobiaceae bacterium]|nr:AraC family transcriptional regulator [Hyphomicrobiaceae bacterium]
MDDQDDIRTRFLAALGRPFMGEELFDVVPDIVFFVKDADGRYVAANRTLVERCRLSGKAELIGRRAAEVFPPALAQRIAAQDRLVLAEGRRLAGELELHLYPGGREGWCLTWKEPLRAADGGIVGLYGLSRDLSPGGLATGGLAAGGLSAGGEMAAVSSAVEHIRDHLDRPLRLPDLARLAGLSQFQLDQRFRALFGLTVGQYVTRARIAAACERLSRSDEPIGAIALECGYSDQAAFTRQFRRSVGITPKAYREGGR